MQVLTGTRIDRSVDDARNGIPLSAANVRAILADMESQIKSETKRRAMAGKFGEFGRNMTDAARQVYLAYANGAKLGPIEELKA